MRTRTFEDRRSAGRAAVYLIHRTDRRRFKLGWALDPVLRAQRLPEFRRGTLDLRGSYALWLSTRKRAEQVERALHKSLAPFQVSPGHQDDGHREWFAPAALPSAVSLLRQMPVQEPESPTALPGLVPLLPDAPDFGAVATDQPADEVWYAIEDLWLRLANELPVRAVGQHGVWRIVVGSQRSRQWQRSQCETGRGYVSTPEPVARACTRAMYRASSDR